MAIHHGEYTSAHVAGQQSRDEARTAASKAAEAKTKAAQDRAAAAAERAKSPSVVTQVNRAKRAAARMAAVEAAYRRGAAGGDDLYAHNCAEIAGARWDKDNPDV